MQTLPQYDDNATFEKLNADAEVKKVSREVPFYPGTHLIDLALKARAFKEDEIFANSKFYRENIRRGLSFIKNGESVGLARKGLQKFFDVRNEYLDVLDGTVQLEALKLKQTEKELYHVIFDDVVSVLEQGGKINVYKTEKANGENAQVSYNKAHDAWVVASKNVSILVKNKEDVERYKEITEGRYAFAILIAETWFKLLSKYVKDVEQLKKDLEGKTIIGEYVGNPKHQHLVGYNEITILFYAMVEYHSERSCLPMQVTQEFLAKHGLPVVKINRRAECANVKELIEILQILTQEVARNTIEEDAEGSVVYFEAKWSEDKLEIMSLSKLKTLEYRFYRKLREKLNSMAAKSKTAKEQMIKYESEVKSLTKGYETAKPLEYYFEVAQLAFDFVESNAEITQKLGLRSRFLDFLNVVRACKDSGRKPTVDDFKKIIEAANDLSGESEGEDL